MLNTTHCWLMGIRTWSLKIHLRIIHEFLPLLNNNNNNDNDNDNDNDNNNNNKAHPPCIIAENCFQQQCIFIVKSLVFF